MTKQRIKANGVHYTPGDLARFLAEVTARHLDGFPRSLQVLDPACGDGALLEAFALALPAEQRHQVRLVGYEKDPQATDQARQRLAAISSNVQLKTCDYLELDGIDGRPHEGGRVSKLQPFDVVIANPPYVRTQVMGGNAAQTLARRFGLTGRVDLYHAFAVAIAHSLNPGGVLGLLTSNRFLSIKSGQSLRALFRTEFDIREVYDLGDTKLFSAAVLPAIVVATKRSDSPYRDSRAAHSAPIFVRVYECQTSESNVTVGPQLLDALKHPTLSGIVQANDQCYHVQRGTLSTTTVSRTTSSRTTGATDVWTLTTPELEEWLSGVHAASACRIGDIASVHVGIKTTADNVFVREDWESLDREERPEKQLLLPLMTHHEAARWGALARPTRKVLYPYVMREGKRAAISLSDYPRARQYLARHEQRLRKRTYVTNSGRQWYEIWVPHRPADWCRNKIVFPDISEAPRFFYDDSGAVVQGDCYWITLRAGVDSDWLLVILAICNSTFITRYYDVVFHNKLYAGRRRFMTQYVKEFPLPSLEGHSGQAIVNLARQVVSLGRATITQEGQLNDLVWDALGGRCD